MPLRVRIVRRAKFEIQDAFAYYRSKSMSTAQRFARNLGAAIQSILDLPHAWTSVTGNLCRRNVPRFPYTVVYHIEDDFVVVVAVLNLLSDPESWHDRLRDY